MVPRAGFVAGRRMLVAVVMIAGSLGASAAVPALARAASYSNTSPITIADGSGVCCPYTPGTGNPYPSLIAVSGLQGTVTNVVVHLAGVTHPNPDDLDVLLVGPQGQSFELLSDAGESDDLTNAGLTFDDAALEPAPDMTGMVAGMTYKPTNWFGGLGEPGDNSDVFPPPAPAGPYANTGAVSVSDGYSTTLEDTFGGTDANGSWRLYVVDDSAGNSGGSFAGGWSLDLTTTGPPPENPPPPPPDNMPPPDVTPPPDNTPPVPRPPLPTFGFFPVRPHVGDLMTFDASRSLAFTAGPTRYNWQVDGRTLVACANLAAVTQRFTTAGTHTVALTVSDSLGQTNSTRESFVVKTGRLPLRRAAASACAKPRYDLRANGIEVTQGTQRRLPSFKGGQLPSYFLDSQDLPGRPAPVDYTGVMLAAHSQTIARFFADSANEAVSGTVAVLRGFRGGQELPGSPLLPEYGPDTLADSGCACVTQAIRDDQAAAFTFVLPDSWTEGTVNLTGSLIPPSAFFDSGLHPKGPPQCASEECLVNDNFTLSGVGFTKTPYVVVAPLRMTVQKQAALPSPASVFAGALNVIPGGNRFLVGAYAADIDVTTIANYTRASAECASYLPANRTDGLDKFGDCKNDKYYDAVKAWEAANRGGSDLVVGVNAQERGIASQVDPVSWSDTHPTALVNINRPLTSVAHELGHNLGRSHAGTEAQCPGGDGVTWPQDDRGYLQGVGLDRRRSFIFATRLGAGAARRPFAILDDGAADQPSNWYELMSYCANTNESTTSGNVPNAWTSPRFWDDDLRALRDFGDKVGYGLRVFATVRPARAAHAAAANRPLRVQARLSDGRAAITLVTPVDHASPAISSSAYTLVARDGGGQILSQTPMRTQQGHAEPGAPFIALEADVPAGPVASLAVVQGAQQLVERSRSAHPPTVRLLAPSNGTRLGTRRSVTVRWTASDADADPLTATVAYSADAGRTWRTVLLARSTGTAEIPRAYFAGSRDARVRVTVNDGFADATAQSGRLTSAGSPPAAAIDAPTPGTSVTSASSVVLRGHGFDDRGRLLLGRRLTWYAGRKLLGRGESIVTTGLRPGKATLRLVATDAAGRRGAASVRILVRKAAPIFTTLRAPAKIARRARTVSVRVAASFPATLRIGARRYVVGRVVRRIVVPAAKGSSTLRLRLTAYRATTIAPLHVRRR